MRTTGCSLLMPNERIRLAGATSISRAEISKWEHGQRMKTDIWCLLTDAAMKMGFPTPPIPKGRKP